MEIDTQTSESSLLGHLAHLSNGQHATMSLIVSSLAIDAKTSL